MTRADQTAPKRKRFEGLDGLRGVAALLVLAIHIGQRFPSFRPVAAGYLGVDLFFVLSGFVIGAAYERRLVTEEWSFGRYMEARLVRLYPMIILGLVLAALLLPINPEHPDHARVRLVCQLFMIPTLWLSGHLFMLNGPQWSLFFELAVNMFHALIARWLSIGRVALLTIVAGAALIAAVHRQFTIEPIGFIEPTFVAGFARVAFSFFSGLFVYRLWERGLLPRWRRIGWLALPIFAVAVIGAGYSRTARADLVVALLVDPLVVVLAVGAEAQLWRGRLASLAGEISYPVYALQAPALVIATAMIGRSTDYSVAHLSAWIAFTAILVGLAYGVRQTIDRPVQKRIAGWLRLRRPAVQAATLP